MMLLLPIYVLLIAFACKSYGAAIEDKGTAAENTSMRTLDNNEDWQPAFDVKEPKATRPSTNHQNFFETDIEQQAWESSEEPHVQVSPPTEASTPTSLRSLPDYSTDSTVNGWEAIVHHDQQQENAASSDSSLAPSNAFERDLTSSELTGKSTGTELPFETNQIKTSLPAKPEDYVLVFSHSCKWSVITVVVQF